MDVLRDGSAEAAIVHTVSRPAGARLQRCPARRVRTARLPHLRGGISRCRRRPPLRGGMFIAAELDVVIQHILEPISRPRNHPPVRPHKAQPVIVFVPDREPAFVHKPVVMRAEQHEIADGRLAACRPMLDVMRMHVEPIATAREGAAAVARPERTAQLRRDDALLAPDVERRAVMILNDLDDAAVAGEAAQDFDRKIRTPDPPAEGFVVGVDDDEVIVGGGWQVAVVVAAPASATAHPHATGMTGERRLRHREQRIRLLCAPAVGRGLAHTAARGRELDPDRLISGLRHALDRLDHHFAIVHRHLDRDPKHSAHRIPRDDERAMLPGPPCRADRLRCGISDLATAFLELGRRHAQGIVEQRVFVDDIDDSRQCPHLRIRQPPILEGCRHRRHLPQRMRRPHFLPRRGQRQIAAPRQPLRTTAHPPLLPAEAIVELTHEDQQTIGLRAHFSSQRTDGQIEVVDGWGHDRGGGRGGGRGRLGRQIAWVGAHGRLRKSMETIL